MSENEAADENPPISIWKRIFISLGAFTLVVIVAGVVRDRYYAAHAGRELHETIEGLNDTDPGWTLDELEANRKPLPKGENSATVIMEVVKALPSVWPHHDFDRQFNDLPMAEVLDAERLALLEREMDTVAAALALARPLAGMPQGRHRLEHAANPMATLLPDQQETRRVAQLLNYDVLRQSNKGDIDQALRSARATLNAGRSLGDEPFIISHLIRTALVHMALAQAERSLSLGEAYDGALVDFAMLLALEEKHPTMLVSLRGERGMLHKMYEGMANRSISGKDVAAMLNDGSGQSFGDWRLRLFGLSRTQVERSHAQTLLLMTRSVEVARLPAHLQIAEEAKLEAEVKALPRELVLARLMLPAVSKSNEAFRRKLALVRVMQALVALERERRKTGKWPDKLPLAPLDPYDGKPLRYKKLADGVLVYSIGMDGVDDGGNVDRSRMIGPGVDIGFRLWDVKARRQPAKPRPKQVADDGPGGPGGP